MLIQRIFPRFSAARCRQAAQWLTCAGLVLLLVLSEVFSSNIQETLPAFSHWARLVLTGAAGVALSVKISLFTRYETRWQPVAVALLLGFGAFAAVFCDDLWCLLALLVGLAAKDVDLHSLLRVYVITAAAGLALVQLLHVATSLVPYHFYCRNWDFGYGHYNGYAARLLGLVFGWAWLRLHTLRWWDWLGMGAMLVYIALAPGSRGAMLAVALLLVLLAVWRLAPKLLCKRLFSVVSLLTTPLLLAFSLVCGWFFDPEQPLLTPVLARLNGLLSGRFEIWHHVFWGFDYTHPAEDGVAAWFHGDMPSVWSLFGSLATDGDPHHAMDNTYLATIMNKGVVGAIFLMVLLLLLLWQLLRRDRHGEVLLCLAMLVYLFFENKVFLISANPLMLLLPVLLAAPPALPRK